MPFIVDHLYRLQRLQLSDERFDGNFVGAPQILSSSAPLLEDHSYLPDGMANGRKIAAIFSSLRTSPGTPERAGRSAGAVHQLT